MKLKAIQKFKQKPSHAGDLHKLLEFIGYYRSSTRDFTKKAKPLYNSLSTPATAKSKQKNFSKKSKGQKLSSEAINWTIKHEGTLENFIETLKFLEVIAYQDFSLPFTIHCDARKSGLGTILYEKQ